MHAARVFIGFVLWIIGIWGLWVSLISFGVIIYHCVYMPGKVVLLSLNRLIKASIRLLS